MHKSSETQPIKPIMENNKGKKNDSSKAVDKKTELNDIVIDSLIEHMLLENAEKINAGNNGVIFLINLDDLDKETIKKLKAVNPELFNNEHQEMVIKMLKVYTGGQGKREFEFQKKAYQAIQAATEQDPDKPLAKVPLPYFYRELDISQNEALQKKVKAAEVNSYNRQIEVILMDFIPGKDLATFLYQEVLKYHPETKYLAQTKNQDGKTALEEMDIEQLQDEVSRALKFSLPPGGNIFLDDRVIRIFNENKNQLINFLKKQHKHGFKMPKNILIKLKNSIELFRQNGFEHNDLHERNIIIGRGEKVYIIDFGAAKTIAEKEAELQGTDEDVKQAELGHILRQDAAILSTIEKLSLDTEQETRLEDDRKLKELTGAAAEIISHNLEIQKEFSEWGNITTSSELLEKIYLLSSSITNNLELQAQIEAGLLYKFLQKNKGLFDNEELKKIYAAYRKRGVYQQKLIGLVVKNFLK